MRQGGRKPPPPPLSSAFKQPGYTRRLELTSPAGSHAGVIEFVGNIRQASPTGTHLQGHYTGLMTAFLSDFRSNLTSLGPCLVRQVLRASIDLLPSFPATLGIESGLRPDADQLPLPFRHGEYQRQGEPVRVRAVAADQIVVQRLQDRQSVSDVAAQPVSFRDDQRVLLTLAERNGLGKLLAPVGGRS